MKKIISLVIALLLAISICAFAETEAAAQPETRTSVITIEGIEEEITETFFVSEDGYSMWYQADMLNVDTSIGYTYIYPVSETTEEDAPVDFASSHYLIIVPVEIPYDATDAFLLEATGGFDPSVAVIGEPTGEVLENGIEIKSISVTENDIAYNYYIVTDGEKVLCITGVCSVEAMEGWGARFYNTVRTIEFR